jgi:hypothetical protein
MGGVGASEVFSSAFGVFAGTWAARLQKQENAKAAESRITARRVIHFEGIVLTSPVSCCRSGADFM